MKTRITELLGIEYPILMGGMQWISRAEFVAAVSQAGGLAFISSSSFQEPEELRAEIRKARRLTQKPIGVNISMLPDVSSGEKTMDYLQVAVEEQIPVIETAGRSPEDLVPVAKRHGVKVIHKVPAARFAVKAEKAGVDAVVIVGYEAGGHPGMDKVGTMVVLQNTVQAVTVPVIAAGGICNGQSMLAALVMGAEGVTMGTRLLATEESPIHSKCKDWMLTAKETDTIITQKSIRNAFRCVRNPHAYQVLGMEQEGTTLKELLPHISGRHALSAWYEGDMERGQLAMGQDVGLIHDVPMIRELFLRMETEMEEARDRIAAF